MDNKLKQALFVLLVLISTYVAYHLLGPVSMVIQATISLIMPFIVGLGLAFIFHPIVVWLEGKRVPTVLGKLLVIVLVIGITAGTLWMLLPQITEQLVETIKLIPLLVTDIVAFIESLDLFASSFNLETELNSMMLSVLGTSSELALWILKQVVDTLDFIVFTPILFMYFLFDYRRLREYFKEFLRTRKYHKFYALMKEYEKELHHYVTGTLIVLAVMTVASFVAFYFAGLNNAMLFGFVVGITNILPIIGNPIGGLIAAAFALKQSTTLALIIVIEVAVLTIVESNFVTPLIQSSKVKIHPIAIIFGIVVLGYILGFFGVLIAIPILLFVRLLHKYYSIYGEKYKV